MIDALGDVNWIAVLVAAVVWFVLGAAWYMTPVIARKWQQAGGIEVADDESADLKMFALTFVAYVVAAIVTAMLIIATGAAGPAGGAGLGATVGVGYALTAAAVSAIYDTKPEPFTWFWINGVFNLIGLTAVGGVIGAFG